jgi:hypothetical protein
MQRPRDLLWAGIDWFRIGRRAGAEAGQLANTKPVADRADHRLIGAMDRAPFFQLNLAVRATINIERHRVPPFAFAYPSFASGRAEETMYFGCFGGFAAKTTEKRVITSLLPQAR